MKTMLVVLPMLLLASLDLLSPSVQAQTIQRDIPYVEDAAERQVLDIYSPTHAKDLPVVFWIHGGGWQAGDKSQVETKPASFNENGFVFVSTNYRLLPHVDMETLVTDVAKSLGWVHRNIAKHGGDANRIFVMGHSAGAQLAAILCTNERYLTAERVPFSALKGCVPVDGDTYDIPAMIETAETRRRVHKQPQAKFGHREKFGNDPALHLDFSAVTHIKNGKSIPPFLILYVSSHPDTSAQAERLSTALADAGVSGKLFGVRDSGHTKLNDDLGLPEDAATKALLEFTAECLKN